ncbi:MAG TPA: phosphopyruvate hydratase, partial [Magnetospirillum sp.]|nr:phosphopyruvate hydratase [Magnetospirillum sp.]
GVLTAVRNVRGEIARRLEGMDARDQGAIDGALIELDGSPSLRRLGANGVLAASLAVARAAAAHQRVPLYRHVNQLAGGPAMCLPMPMTNLLSGGHSGAGLDFQDVMMVPLGAASFADAVAMIARVRAALPKVADAQGIPLRLAEDGGAIPGISDVGMVFEMLMRSFEAAGLQPGAQVAIAVDVAASELHRDGHYALAGGMRRLSRAGMIDMLRGLVGRFPIVSVEDALDQDDWDGWCEFTRAAPDIQIVGDDLFATNAARIARGIKAGAANAALIKLNQNGTLTGTITAIGALRAAGFGTIVAARSGDTEDTFMADFAVGTGVGQIKIGAFRNTERVAKYNRLSRIEEEAGLPFAGAPAIRLRQEG